MDLKASKWATITVIYLIFFFADDAVFLAKWTVENAINLIRILFCFKRVSGLAVNMDKSILYGVGIQQEELKAMSFILGCNYGNLPSTFLGIPIGKNMKRIDAWNPLVEKFKKKIVFLETKYPLDRRKTYHCYECPWKYG